MLHLLLMYSGVALLGTKLYILGGLLHHEVLFDRATSALDSYDLETGEWGKEPAFPHSSWEHCLATLLVPVSRDIS
jgi:hypothetical protein